MKFTFNIEPRIVLAGVILIAVFAGIGYTIYLLGNAMSDTLGGSNAGAVSYSIPQTRDLWEPNPPSPRTDSKSLPKLSTEELTAKANEVAEEIAIRLSRQEYSELYDLFVPQARARRSREDFVIYVNASISSRTSGRIWKLDKVSVLNEKEAYAYYTEIGIIQQVVPPLLLEYVPTEGWRMNAFSYFFTSDCIQECPSRGCVQYTCNRETGYRCKEANIC